MLSDPNVLVGSVTSDDAGVYRLNQRQALVQTIDFFTPIVDDPFTYGRIAAANALSDIYAMGGRPLTAMNVLGVPTELVPEPVVQRILRGGATTVKAAGCVLLGGHSIRNPEPLYGLSVTGIVNPRRMITNAAARPGDLLVLTKPLGTGIATTAIKRRVGSKVLAHRAIASMCLLNQPGTELAERGLAKAGTDVTGFGLLGHLGALCRASDVGAEIWAAEVPVLHPTVWDLMDCAPGGSRENLRYASSFTSALGVDPNRLLLLADAQTSGGLLLCVKPSALAKVRQLLRSYRTLSQCVIGRVVKREGRSLIRVLENR